MVWQSQIRNLKYNFSYPPSSNFYMIGTSPPESQINIKLQHASLLSQSQDRHMVPIKRIQNYSYTLSDQIGLGLTSRVFKGKNDISNQTVAIKVIDLKGNQDKLHNEFIQEQVETLERIRSCQTENLLKVEAVVRSKNNLYLMTEFCEGKDVGKLLRNKKTLSEVEAQSIMKQLINGYKQLFNLGIVHRDLKLSNLFIRKGKIKIADFGFSIPANKCNTNFTYNVGSPYYMPPETLKYNRYSFYSDVWAIGIMAFEIVYGKAPWKDKIDAKLFDLMLKTPLQSLFDPQIMVSNEYKGFIKKCLALNQKERMNPDELFNYKWTKAVSFVEGVVEPTKVPEVIKVPGNNYAVFNELTKKVSFEEKKMDVDDFKNKKMNSAEVAIIGQMDFCLFMRELYKILKEQKNTELPKVTTEISYCVREKLKMLGELVRSEKNILQVPGFSTYIKSGSWQNLKQVIIRYDIQFRELFKTEPPFLKLYEKSPPNNQLINQIAKNESQSVSTNWRLIELLFLYKQIRHEDMSNNPLNFAEHSGIHEHLKRIQNQKNQFNAQKVGVLQKKLKEL